MKWSIAHIQREGIKQKSRFSAILSLIMVTVFIASCANTGPIPSTACLFADGSQQVAPTWVCRSSDNGAQRTAVGYAAASITGPSFSEQMATRAAKMKLLRHLRVDLNHIMPLYISQLYRQSELIVLIESPAQQDLISQQLTSSLQAQLNHQFMQEMAITKTMVTPSGAAVVLLELDRLELFKLFDQAIQQAELYYPLYWQALFSQYDSTDLAATLIRLLEQQPSIEND